VQLKELNTKFRKLNRSCKMPSKGKQRASRQAQLRNRKRKSAKSQVVDSRTTTTAASDPKTESVLEPVEQLSSNTESKPVRRVPTTAQAGVSTLRYEYLGSEVKRIAIVAAIIVVLLVALSFSSITA